MNPSDPANRPARTIRPAEPTDLPMLYRSELQYMRDIEGGQLDGWMQAIDRNLELWTANLPRARVAEVGGVPAGIMLWMPLPEGAAVLVTLHVLPGLRRHGIGRLLLDTFITDARTGGAPRSPSESTAAIQHVLCTKTPVSCTPAKRTPTCSTRFRRRGSSVPGCAFRKGCPGGAG